MKKSNEIKIVKRAILIINTIALITTAIAFYTENIYMLYFNMGILSVLLFLLLLIVVLDSKRREKKNAKNNRI